MALNNAYNQYKESSIYTSTPEELTLMLYNGLVRFIMQAIKAVEENDIQKANNCIIRAQDIITEFETTLDRSYEISNNLLLLYDYMHRRLVEANIAKNTDILNEVLDMAKELRDTWVQAIKIYRQQSGRTQNSTGQV